MALWQFAFTPFPAGAAKVSGVDAIRLDPDILSGRHWDMPPGRQQALFAALTALLPERPGWCEEMRIWGDTKSNDIQIFFDAKDIASIEIRLDVSRLSLPLVDGICALAREFGWVFVSEAGAIIQPTREAIIRVVEQSRAQQFVNDPVGYLASASHAKRARTDGTGRSS
jgi:hypothetical protein